MKKIKIKKPSLAKLRRKAFKLWSEIVRKQGICEYCRKKYGEIKENGKPVVLNSHHLIGRENHSLCFDVQNGISLCQNCHKFSPIGAHKGGLIFHDWFMKTYPEKYKYLLENYKNNVIMDVEYVQNIIKKLENYNK